MQTFLPYSTYSECAKVLDSKRLNKQILECYQILNILSGQSSSSAWRNHPAVLMWSGSESHLYNYTLAMVDEALSRGIKVGKNLLNLKTLYKKCHSLWGYAVPSWYLPKHRKYVNTTHQVSLYHKDPIYYIKFKSAVDSPYNAPCCPDRKTPCKYYWVTHQTRVQ